MGDNRFPWQSRAQREDNDWVAQQRGMLAQQFVNGQALGWMALEVSRAIIGGIWVAFF